ncbi:MAG: protein translocase subunit SecD [Armatimonadetes bacterium]|nr:protein translocase subunit SecD [Armatimonadota bacterium]
MQSNNKGYIFLGLVVALTALSVWAYQRRDFQYGLDIRGGIRMTYKVKNLTEDQKKNLPTIMSNLTGIMTNRAAQTLGVVEGSVQVKNEDQLIVELPGFTDPAKARETISSTASIKAYYAKNVTTEFNKYAKYVELSRDANSTEPIVEFSTRNAKAGDPALKPGDPAYKEMIEGWDLILEGSDLKKAYPMVGNSGATQPHFEFSGEGARKMETWSRSVMGRGAKLAFVLDGKVLSIAPLKDDVILSDNAFIDGTFDAAYVNQLCALLNAGALPVELEEIGNEVVDPTIGQYAKDQMVRSGIIAFALTAVFLLAYYLFPGLVALVALSLYVLFTLTVMKQIGATFSLAAIAGFILSVGMAVDANILVFERVKEEMREGRTLLTAVELGFKRAFSAIFDSNACTIITSIVLMVLGTGAVKGFASTLILGVAISFFTAVTVTRSLLVFLVASGIGNNPKLFGLNRQMMGADEHADLAHDTRHVMDKSKLWFAISVATIIPGVIFILLGGLKPNVEFQGGFEATYKMVGSATATEVVSALETHGFKGSNAKITADEKGNKYVSVTVPPIQGMATGDPKAYDEIARAAGTSVGKMDVPQITGVGPTVQKEMVENAVKAVVISSILIVAYLAIRFGVAIGSLKNGLKFGLSAIGALLHDILVVIGVAAIFGKLLGWEISALFLTSILTVIGFSVHDTIVIFDRIRENLRKVKPGEDFKHLCDRSVTQSFARSIMTSATVIATLAVMIAFGTPTIDLKFFCVVMLTGIVSGTYSSIFNATPILYLWDRLTARTKGEEHTLIAEANAEMNRLRSMAMQTQVAAATAPVVPTATPQSGAAGQRGYGQVRRRRSAVDQSKQEID